MSDIEINIETLRRRIAAAAKKAGTAPETIKLLAVSKTVPPERVKEAIDAGMTDFGENYIQEGVLKASEFKGLCRWHFIGHLQKNKVAAAARHFDVVESIDSEELAEKLDSTCMKLGRRMDVLLQIHFGTEESKHGFLPSEAERGAEKIMSLNNLNLKGFMTIPPLVENPEDNRRYFAEMRNISEKIFSSSPAVLSMGMTDDFEIAIEEGANLIRIGTGIFGRRIYS